MMNYYFDEQRQFSIDRGDLIKRMKGKSEQTMHNLIRCLYRPNCLSTNHWLDEMNGFLILCLVDKVNFKRRPIEFLFYRVGKNCEVEGLFSLSQWKLAEECVVSMSENMYGAPRKLGVDKVAFGLWIFYRMIDPEAKYDREDMQPLVREWHKIISNNPDKWAALSQISSDELRYY